MKTRHQAEVKRLGELLTEQGSLRGEEIARILELQQRDAESGVASKFGEVCVRTGCADASEVNRAVSNQQQEVIAHTGLGDMLLSLGMLTPEQLEAALECRMDVFEPLDELLVDQGLCTHEQVRIASQLLALRRNGAARSQVASTFAPFNIMELLVCEQINDALREDGQCQCSQCWSNVFAAALNELPARYISEHGRILDYVDRFRQDYEELVSERLAEAVEKVRTNPKAACRSRFSDELLSRDDYEVQRHDILVHVSNHHVHLSQDHVEKLFGAGHQLTKLKDLMQPGQYAAEETTSLLGPKGQLEKVRVLGPPRPQTQVEISGTDQFVLGLRAPVRESGRLEGSPGLGLKGPEGEVQLETGMIRALRHIHMLPEDADRMGLKNGEHVSVRLVGDRTTICEGVLVRATKTSALEMHIDTDEANAAGLPAESQGEILVPTMLV